MCSRPIRAMLPRGDAPMGITGSVALGIVQDQLACASDFTRVDHRDRRRRLRYLVDHEVRRLLALHGA
jgi:hypothetical protein